MKKSITFTLCAILLMSAMILTASAYTTYYGSDRADLTNDLTALYYGDGSASVAVNYSPKALLTKARCESYVFPNGFSSSGCTGGTISLYMTDGTNSDSDYVSGTFNSNYTNVDVTVKVSNNASQIISEGTVWNASGNTVDAYEMTIVNG